VQITNQGGNAVNVSLIELIGANYKDFSQTNNCGTQIAAGASCTISVTFTPVKTGVRKAKMTISDDGGGSPQKVSIEGTGS
jgi:hypothetical protein